MEQTSEPKLKDINKDSQGIRSRVDQLESDIKRHDKEILIITACVITTMIALTLLEMKVDK